MSLYPEVQKKAQAELDAVVGSHCFPEFSDRENLPYINAIVKEIFRWNPVTPLGLARLSTSDDHYNGYFIPGGSIVMINTWYVDPTPLTATSGLILGGLVRMLTDGILDLFGNRYYIGLF